MNSVQVDPFKDVGNAIEQDQVLCNQLVSLIVFGSYIRGDFVESQSDLDIFAVFDRMTKTNISKLTDLIEKHVKINYRVLDFACSNFADLDDPLTKGYPFKFLIAHQDDFRENHLVLYGSDIVSLLPDYNWDEIKHSRANRLVENIERYKDKSHLLPIGAGQTILFMTREAGATGIGKKETMRVLKQIRDEQAIEIFSAYISGIKLDYPREYWVNFVKSRLESYVT